MSILRIFVGCTGYMTSDCCRVIYLRNEGGGERRSRHLVVSMCPIALRPRDGSSRNKTLLCHLFCESRATAIPTDDHFVTAREGKDGSKGFQPTNAFVLIYKSLFHCLLTRFSIIFMTKYCVRSWKTLLPERCWMHGVYWYVREISSTCEERTKLLMAPWSPGADSWRRFSLWGAAPWMLQTGMHDNAQFTWNPPTMDDSGGMALTRITGLRPPPRLDL